MYQNHLFEFHKLFTYFLNKLFSTVEKILVPDTVTQLFN